MNERGSTDAGGVIGVIVLLAGLAWLAAVLILGHVKMGHDEAYGHRDASKQIISELGLHRVAGDAILEPKFDGSLDVFVSRPAFESVPYPDQGELAAAVSDIWCSQVSSVLLPVVHFRDVQTGSTLLTERCIFLSSSEIDGNYSGTVHNNMANVDSTFQVQMISTAHGLRGCMQVDLPLVGTGPVRGTLNQRSLVLNLASPNVNIRFDGYRVGHSITGRYTVTSNGQVGTFALHQNVPRVESDFDPNGCPR